MHYEQIWSWLGRFPGSQAWVIRVGQVASAKSESVRLETIESLPFVHLPRRAGTGVNAYPVEFNCQISKAQPFITPHSPWHHQELGLRLPMQRRQRELTMKLSRSSRFFGLSGGFDFKLDLTVELKLLMHCWQRRKAFIPESFAFAATSESSSHHGKTCSPIAIDSDHAIRCKSKCSQVKQKAYYSTYRSLRASTSGQ
jgi:hypothetical protein